MDRCLLCANFMVGSLLNAEKTPPNIQTTEIREWENWNKLKDNCLGSFKVARYYLFTRRLHF